MNLSCLPRGISADDNRPQRNPSADPPNIEGANGGANGASAEPRATDRIANIAIARRAQLNIVALFRSRIEQNISGDELLTEIAEVLQIEGICSADALSNSDLFRRIRQILHDAG